eukprot:1158274-Pelagomonas_calceolata.AAC.23
MACTPYMALLSGAKRLNPDRRQEGQPCPWQMSPPFPQPLRSPKGAPVLALPLTNERQLLLPAADLRQEGPHKWRGKHGLQVEAHVLQEHSDLQAHAYVGMDVFADTRKTR